MLSRLSLIDLAGSERAAVSENKGIRFMEGILYFNRYWGISLKGNIERTKDRSIERTNERSKR